MNDGDRTGVDVFPKQYDAGKVRQRLLAAEIDAAWSSSGIQYSE